MKNLAVLIVLLIFSGSVYAQIQEENFSSESLPDGWKFDHNSRISNWKFGYNGVMPHSGPTIESEFTTGAALFNNGEGKSKRGEVSLISPRVDLSALESAHLEVTYNLQVSDDEGEFIIEIYDGKRWKQVYNQNTASPQNTGMNELVLLDVADLVNDKFQVRFVFDDNGKDKGHSLAIDHFKLSEAVLEDAEGESSLSTIDFRYLEHSVLVLDADENLKEDNMDNLAEHLSEYELTTDSTFYRNMNELTANRQHLRLQEDDNVGSFKVLTK